MRVEGAELVAKLLLEMTGRERQNIEKKAARAAMNKLKKDLQVDWRGLRVSDPSKGRRSIRKHAAKALTVRVSGRGRGVTARVHMNYHKKNASKAKLAHFLEFDHMTGGGNRLESGTSLRALQGSSNRAAASIGWSKGKHPTARRFRSQSGKYRDYYMRAVMAWIKNPKAKAKTVGASL